MSNPEPTEIVTPTILVTDLPPLPEGALRWVINGRPIKESMWHDFS